MRAPALLAAGVLLAANLLLAQTRPDSAPAPQQEATVESLRAELQKLKTDTDLVLWRVQQPLVVGENIAKMTLKDGRVLTDAVVSSIGVTSITVRTPSEARTIQWSELDVVLRIRTALAIVTAATKGSTTPAVTPPASAETPSPVGDRVYIGPIAVRVIEDGETYTYYAWTAKVGNPTDSPARRRPDITFFDRDGFKLEDALGESGVIPPHSFRVLTGKSLMKTPLWKQVANYEVSLVDR